MSFSEANLSGEFLHHKGDVSVLCEKVLNIYKDSDEVVQSGRNVLKKVEFERRTCVVKAFRVPSFPQDYIYGLFAKSKAQKSYSHAQKLLDLGFQTPAPVGYFEYCSGGRLEASYYVCEYAEGVRTLFDIYHERMDLERDLMQDFMAYSQALHVKGILHRDFNLKNILVSTMEGEHKFSLVDINRITWYDKLPLEKAMKSLSRLPFEAELRSSMLAHYAQLAGVDVSRCETLLNQSIGKTQRYFRNKRRLRKVFPKKK